MSKPIPLYRKLFLSGKIEALAVASIINEIHKINFDDDKNEEEYRDWVREPIKLFINSFGGSVYDGLALVDVIKQSKTPIHTIVIGSGMSMGLWIFLSGHKRFIGANSTLMFHDISCGIWDKSEGIKLELEEMLRLQKMLCTEIVESTLITQAKLDDYITRKAEWYISSKDALALRLADEYYKEI